MTETADISLTQPGRFVVGCNYWASHAGTRTWSDWRADVVEADFQLLSSAGLQVLRVFPLWPDFQPLTPHRAGQGALYELREGETPFPEDEAGRAGVSAEAIQHFQHLADLAEKYQLKLVVGLITGWMSGRLFVPPAFEGLNVLTDPLAIQWQVRFVRYFVRHFKDHPAILAWDLGNECNCMASAPSRQAAWLWTSAITNAVRLEDLSRPVVSGMHSLLPDKNAAWTMQDQGELTDLLTTHPYPYFTPHCDLDPVNTIRTILHSTSESRFYADIGGKPCLAEELGTLGPILASETVAADFIRSCLFSLWANDCHGLLWWCAFDQLYLEHSPYDWNSCERELGLIRENRSAKPVLKELSNFRGFLERLPVKALPQRQCDAVCILTAEQDTWGAAYSSFILAKQAGFDLEFQFAEQPLKHSALYLLPSLCGNASLSRRRWLELLERVKQGAVLYVSHHDCLLSPFNEPFGLEVQTRQRRSTPVEIRVGDGPQSFDVGLNASFRLNLKPAGAEVLGREQDGNPAFTCNTYGKGKIYFLTVPVELELTRMPGALHAVDAPPFWKIYRTLAENVVSNRIVAKDLPLVGLTEHPVSAEQRIVVAVNYSPEPQSPVLTLAPGWSLKEVWRGDPNTFTISANDAMVFVVQRP